MKSSIFAAAVLVASAEVSS